MRWGGDIYASLNLYSPWKEILLQWWVLRKFKNVDEFPDGSQIMQLVKSEVTTKDYVRLYDFLQFIIRCGGFPTVLIESISGVLERARAPYRIIDKTFVPIASAEEALAIEQAFEAARESTAGGPSVHLQKAAAALSSGNWAEAVRESIHAVESAAKSIEPSASTLGPALTNLEKSGALNPAMKRAFLALYGYASDEKGVRHALVFESETNVGEREALFMFGACASFITFLLRKQ